MDLQPLLNLMVKDILAKLEILEQMVMEQRFFQAVISLLVFLEKIYQMVMEF